MGLVYVGDWLTKFVFLPVFIRAACQMFRTTGKATHTEPTSISSTIPQQEKQIPIKPQQKQDLCREFHEP